MSEEKEGEMIELGTKDFIKGKPFRVTDDDLEKRWGSPFRCQLCGHWFKAGDEGRWVYANFKDSPFKGGDFFVCGGCDGEDVLERAGKIREESKRTHWWLWHMVDVERENARHR